MDAEHRKIIVQRRIEKSKESIDEAKMALEHNQFRSTLNRIYYAIFYIVSALAAKHDFATSKHIQLMGWFNKEFVKTGFVKPEFWDIYSKSYKNCQESDYLDFVKYSKEEIEQNYSSMLTFISEIEKLINEN